MLINIFDKVRLGILLLASLLGHFQIGSAPASTGDNSMDSDEELKPVNEVDELESKLKQAGQHINPKLSDFFYKSLESKSTAERIPKWMTRINTLRERLENHSGSSAVSPVVAHHDQRQKDRKRKADSPSEPEIQLHEAKVADGMKKKNSITISIKNPTMDRRRLCAHYMCILSECPWMNSKKKEINVSKSKTCWIHGIHPSDRNMEEKS